MDLRIKFSNDAEFLRSLDGHAKQVRFALAVALTKTAKFAQEREQAEIIRVFQAPVARTRSALFITPATKDSLVATVAIKDDMSGTAPEKYLRAEVEGGQRRQKRSERAITITYPWLAGGYWVPGSGLKLNASGNVSPALIVRILSDIKAAETTSGYTANRTARSLKRNRNYRAERYFVPPQGSALALKAPGVWVRRGDKIQPALIFVRATTYKRRFDFFAKGEQTVNARFPVEFEMALNMAFATAR